MSYKLLNNIISIFIWCRGNGITVCRCARFRRDRRNEALWRILCPRACVPQKIRPGVDVESRRVSAAEGRAWYHDVVHSGHRRGLSEAMRSHAAHRRAKSIFSPRTTIPISASDTQKTPHQKDFMKDLKLVYQAVTDELPLKNLDSLSAKRGEYPDVINSWENNRPTLSNYFNYSRPIRRIICTTNIVGKLHRRMRKVTKIELYSPQTTRFSYYSIWRSKT